MTAIAGLVLVVGFLNSAFLAFPKGYDAYGHVSKVRYLVDYFPNADWNYEWYSGEFFSEGSFPPLFHYLGGLLVGWFGLSLANVLIVIAAASFVVIACSLYGIVRIATGSRVAGTIASLLLISANAFWSYILLGGLYPRILGMALVSLFAFFFVVYFKTRASWAYVALVLSLAGALSAHLLLGAIGVVLAVLLLRLEAPKLLLLTGLLVAYFYLPFFLGLSRPAPVPFFTRDYSPVSIDSLLVDTSGTLESLPFFVVAVAVTVPAFTYFTSRLVLEPPARRLMPVLAIGGAGALAYALVGVPAPHLFIYNFQPGQALFYAVWFLAGLIGLALPSFRPPHAPRWVLPVIGLAVLGAVLLGPTRITSGVIDAENPAQQHVISALRVDPSDRQHRVGVSWDGGSSWINARLDVPQTRGYQQQGVLDAGWQYWLESRVWSSEPNFDEKDFLLDWYAVRSFYGSPVSNRFAERPDLYAPQDASAQTFDFLNASSILSARATRTALVIGSDSGYRYLLRALAGSDFDSQWLVPLRGGEYVDDHALSELRRFDLVVLYGYRAHDLAASLRMLNAYALAGGDLLIEANSSPLDASSSVPAPIPGSSIGKAQVGPDWKFSAGSSPITGGISLGGFDPAVYNGGQWGISYIPPTAIASWAAPVLLSDGRPVLVAGTLGAGHVVWSGMNLPYHAATTRNREESRLLASEITWAAPKQAPAPAYQAEFVNPQLRRVTVTSEAEGVLFKENYATNWQATVDGRAATIYRAGPDFMYVPVRRGVSYPATVEFAFTHTSLEWTGDIVSGASAVGLIAWALSARLRRRAGVMSPGSN